MKKILFIKWTLIAIFVSTVLTSCGREDIDYGLNETGEISFAQFSFTVNTETETKAGPDVSSYWVKICQSGTTTVVDNNKWQYNKLPSIVTLKTGTYDLVVQSGENGPEPAAWDAPFYGVVKTFTIEKNKVTNLDKMICALQNVKVSITIPNKANFKEEVQDGYTVQVNNGSSGTLTFTEADITAMEAGTKYAYFAAPKSVNTFTVTLSGRRPDNVPLIETSQIVGVKGGEFRKITINVAITGGLRSSLTIDSSMETINENIYIPIEDDIIPPDPTDPTNPTDPTDPTDPTLPDGPTITGDSFNFTFPVGQIQTVVVNIKADAGIQNLKVNIDSPFLTAEMLESVGMSSSFDLANPGSLQSVFEGLGLLEAGTPVKGQKTKVFNITSFTPLLLQAGTHKFILTVIDANGKTATQTLTLTTT